MPRQSDEKLKSAVSSAKGLDDTGAKPTYLGHRERMTERFEIGGEGALLDYELLEMSLYGALKRADTKPIAKALIERFGSFAQVINAPREQLLQMEGVGPIVVRQIKLIRAAALRLSQAEVLEKPVLGSWTAIIEYCHAAMAHNNIESFRLLFLDKKNRLIADEEQQRGTVDHTPVYVREVVKRALELSATALILVHNHPSGDPTPSMADIEMTKKIIAAAEKLGIMVHDHIIVARKGHTSLRQMQLI